MSDWHNIPNVRDKLKWYEDAGRIKLNFFLSIIMAGMVLNGYDGTLIAGLQAFDTWYADLGFPNGTQIGLLNACSPIAGLVVGPVIQYIDDNFGRKWGVRFYSYTLLAGTIVGCVAGLPNVNGYALFVVGRLLIGFGLYSFLMTSLVIVQEITHPRSRSTVAHSWNSYWILGAVISSWTTFGTSYMTTSWQWRLPYVLQVVPAVYLLIAIQFVPETPRFMLSKGRPEEALKFLADYHGNGDQNDPLVQYEFHEMKEAIEREQEAKAQKWSVILKHKSNRHRLSLAALMMFCTSLSGSSIIYYYYVVVFEMVGITGATTQTGIAAGLNMFTWLCQIAAVFVGKRVGRKRILLFVWPCLLASLIAMCAATAIFEKQEAAGMNVAGGVSKAAVACVAFVWVYLGIFNAANPVLWSYPSEIQTFSMRSKGMLVWNTCSQLFSGYTTFVDSIALRSIGWKYYIVYMPLIIIQFILMWRYMVETKGYTLEEIATAFDGSHTDLATLDPYEPAFQTDHLSSDSSHKGRDIEEPK